MWDWAHHSYGCRCCFCLEKPSGSCITTKGTLWGLCLPSFLNRSDFDRFLTSVESLRCVAILCSEPRWSKIGCWPPRKAVPARALGIKLHSPLRNRATTILRISRVSRLAFHVEQLSHPDSEFHIGMNHPHVKEKNESDVFGRFSLAVRRLLKEAARKQKSLPALRRFLSRMVYPFLKSQRLGEPTAKPPKLPQQRSLSLKQICQRMPESGQQLSWTQSLPRSLKPPQQLKHPSTSATTAVRRRNHC